MGSPVALPPGFQIESTPEIPAGFQVEQQTKKPGAAEQYQQFGKDHPYLAGALSMIPGVGALAPGADEFHKGVAKQVARDAYNLVTSKAAGPLGMLADYVGKKFGITSKVEAATAPANENQQAGGNAATAAELAIPGPETAAKVAEVIPTAEKAGAKFAEVMGAAQHVPINVNLPGDVALKTRNLADAGGSMPKVINDFLKRVTDPDKGPLTYEEGRMFASNASRLSADEAQRLTPVMKRQAAQFAAALNASLSQAAAQVGKLDEYQQAMSTYHNAMRLRALGEGAKDALTSTLAKTVAGAGAGAAGAYGVRELMK